jgi:hypothetical protein
VGTFTGISEVTADVIGVDKDSPSITVTEAEAGAPADPPGEDSGAATAAGPNVGARGAAGAIAGRRTLPVDPRAAGALSGLGPGDRVTLTCDTTGAAGAPGAGAMPPATGAAGAQAGITGGLDSCTRVTAITPQGSGGRGR